MLALRVAAFTHRSIDDRTKLLAPEIETNRAGNHSQNRKCLRARITRAPGGAPVRYQWNSTFFGYWLIIEDATEKVLQFIMQFKSIYVKNLGFMEWKMYFWTLQRGSNKKKSFNRHHFCHEKKFLVTFSELPSIGLY